VSDPGRSRELHEDAVDSDQMLTNVSIYWFTGTGASAARFLYESHAFDRVGRRAVRRRGGPCSPPNPSCGR
jgi:hypothetical protein